MPTITTDTELTTEQLDTATNPRSISVNSALLARTAANRSMYLKEKQAQQAAFVERRGQAVLGELTRQLALDLEPSPIAAKDPHHQPTSFRARFTARAAALAEYPQRALASAPDRFMRAVAASKAHLQRIADKQAKRADGLNLEPYKLEDDSYGHVAPSMTLVGEPQPHVDSGSDASQHLGLAYAYDFYYREQLEGTGFDEAVTVAAKAREDALAVALAWRDEVQKLVTAAKELAAFGVANYCGKTHPIWNDVRALWAEVRATSPKTKALWADYYEARQRLNAAIELAQTTLLPTQVTFTVSGDVAGTLYNEYGEPLPLTSLAAYDDIDLFSEAILEDEIRRDYPGSASAFEAPRSQLHAA